MTNLKRHILGMLGSAVLATAVSGSVEIGSRRELFVDRLLIEDLHGTTLKLHSPQLAPAVTPSRPVGHYATVIKDGDLYRVYYRGEKVPGTGWKKDGFDKTREGELTLGAESRDAINWTLPNFGVHRHANFPSGNIILADEPLVTHNFTPFIDSRPGVSRELRYKGIGGLAYQKQFLPFRAKLGPGGLSAFGSPDGIHWKRMQSQPVIPDEWGMFDSQNVAFWSELESMYVCYFRVFEAGKRSIARTTSLDFLTWTEPVRMKPNAPNEELYTNGTQPYFRAPHIYIALPTRFVAKRGAATDIALMSSRGGNSYDRTFMESFIRPGPGKDGWADRANYAAIGIHQTSPWEMSLFLTGGRRYTLRLDGFSSINAPFSGGEMRTKPLIFTGDSLEINYATSAGGQMRIEIQDETGKPLPGLSLEDCLPIFGDEVARTVQWKTATNLNRYSGRPVRLRIEMFDADLYSIKFNR